MADLELFSRHMAINQAYDTDVSSGQYMFGVWRPIGCFERYAAALLLCNNVPVEDFRLDAAEDDAGTNATPVATLDNPGNLTTAGQTALMEVKASDAQQALAAATHVNIWVNTHGAGRIVATLVRYRPRFAYASLTVPTESSWS